MYYGPFSVYSPIPWVIVFNIVSAILMMLADAVLREAFTDARKGSLCLLLFMLHLLYLLYTIVIHMHLFFLKCGALVRRKQSLYPITFGDLFNIIIGTPLTWVWLFLALYYFDDALYTDVVNVLNTPGNFYLVYFKFLAYTLVALYASTTTIQPLHTISEMAQGIAVVFYDLVSSLVIGSLLTYLLDSLMTLSNA